MTYSASCRIHGPYGGLDIKKATGCPHCFRDYMNGGMHKGDRAGDAIDRMVVATQKTQDNMVLVSRYDIDEAYKKAIYNGKSLCGFAHEYNSLKMKYEKLEEKLAGESGANDQ